MTEQIIRENRKQGRPVFITDDNFARNSDWEILLDRVIKLQGRGHPLRLHYQVDTLCPSSNFIEKATKAGARRIFIGLENINPESSPPEAAEQITEYRVMLRSGAPRRACSPATSSASPRYKGIDPAGYRDHQARTALDSEFFFLTPLPGSEDHKTC